MPDNHNNTNAQRIVRQLLDGRTEPFRAQTELTQRRVATLERRAPTIVREAARAGTEITYLGINPLFREPRLYEGADTDWVLAPVTGGQDLVVPKEERAQITRLALAEINFPLIYVAHEVEKAKTAPHRTGETRGPVTLEATTAKDLVGPVPAPPTSVELAERLDGPATKIVNGLRRTAGAAAAVAAAPLALAAAATELDPIILGAIPAGKANVGEPAAWFVLAQWVW